MESSTVQWKGHWSGRWETWSHSSSATIPGWVTWLLGIFLHFLVTRSCTLLPAHTFPILWMPRKNENITHLAAAFYRMNCGAAALEGQMACRCLFLYGVWCKRRSERKIMLSEPTHSGRLAPHPTSLTCCSIGVVCHGTLSTWYLTHPLQLHWLFPGFFPWEGCMFAEFLSLMMFSTVAVTVLSPRGLHWSQPSV